MNLENLRHRLLLVVTLGAVVPACNEDTTPDNDIQTQEKNEHCTALTIPEECTGEETMNVSKKCTSVRCYNPQGRACLPIQTPSVAAELAEKLDMPSEYCSSGPFGRVVEGPECGAECCYVVSLASCAGRPLRIDALPRLASLTSGGSWAG